ncbi:MAG: hypothetical protein ACI4GC_05990 [Acutalibacteraceae bacterium]
MSKSYRHIQQYEKEMLELKSEGVTVREIGERFGLTYEQTWTNVNKVDKKK